MARTVGRLTALKVEKAKQGKERPGMYHDGAGLYLQVTPGGASWVLRYQLAGRARYMGLGPVALYGLGDARARALDAKRLRHEQIDPIEARRQARLRMRLDAAKAMTFKDAAERYIAAHSAAWSGAKVKALWEATLETYAEPVIGAHSRNPLAPMATKATLVDPFQTLAVARTIADIKSRRPARTRV